VAPSYEKGEIAVKEVLEKAWNWRQKSGLFDRLEAAVRVFHGPGESFQKTLDLHSFAVDRFANHYWVTQWERSNLSSAHFDRVKDQILEFYQSKGAESLGGVVRPERGGLAQKCEIWWGKTPEDKFVVHENGCRFWIKLQNTRHPGLFLDHEPLRRWLIKNAQGWNVLNTFAYTGSLSVAAEVGKAKSITTLDLSQSTIQWAKENRELNGFTGSSSRWIVGDVFEWLPRLKKEKQIFDCILLDPPSFSHGKRGRFSTTKDLPLLHEQAMDLLSPEGVLVSSINSANVSWKKFESDILSAAKSRKMEFQILKQIDLPESFPTLLGQAEDRYLKGWILKRI